MRETTRVFATCGALALLLSVGCGGGSSGALPQVHVLDPAEGGIEGGTLVTVTGTGFSKGVETVTFAWDRAADVDVVGDTMLTCVTPPGPAGACDVAIVLADTAVVLQGSFTYLPPAPTLTAVTPGAGPPNVDTVISVRGTGFLHGPVTVTLDGRNCENPSVANDTLVTCTVPVPGSGTDLPVTVTTAGGTATLPDAFSYVPYDHDGEYFFVEFTGFSLDPGYEARTRWGTLVTDGSGTYTGGEVWENHAGVPSGPLAPSERPYFIDAKRGFCTGSMDDPVEVGRISEDASLVVVGSVRPGIPAATRILGRVEGTYDDSSLDGAYYYGVVDWLPQGIGYRGAAWGTATFGADGSGSYDVQEHVEDWVYSVSSGTFAYSVAPRRAAPASRCGGIASRGRSSRVGMS